ncbi:OLC1v1027141C1 [Oldenlandia corymbosa var. corymbosa]|uniref:myrcene synthase n=1 Tax=Oldenlandia corymbosa var. corymbosa TaxID=529605 RepID=A0AAV1CAQ4_OLDCO|nr:OLC1v1027141C1 [Oldenlandia corymbosa var. corymbosa]
MKNLAEKHFINPLQFTGISSSTTGRNRRFHPKFDVVSAANSTTTPSSSTAGAAGVSDAKLSFSATNVSTTALLTSSSGSHKLQPSRKRSSDEYQTSPNWDFNLLQSLQHNYAGEEQIKRIEVLKGLVVMMLDEEEVELIHRLELIDNLERLGICYHFEPRIISLLSRIHSRDRTNEKQHLYSKALEFKLLRQHGFDVSPDAFDAFKDEEGTFAASLLKDPKGMLYLYEASHLQINDEETNLEMAREFTTKYLKKRVDENGFGEEEPTLAELVRHSLEIPQHWRMKRLESRWFVDLYEKSPNMNPILLEFAKIDFNVVQKSYQDELKRVSRWWKNTGMGEELNFARDILVDNFLWNVGFVWKHEQGYSRIMGTKAVIFITLLDDLYDTYANLDELELFTSAIQRWDVNSVNELPGYMKHCFIGLHSFINEAAYYAPKQLGLNLVPYLTKSVKHYFKLSMNMPWADLCGAYLQEAKWYFSKYVPSFEEYLNNALISVAAPLVISLSYLLTSNSIEKGDLDCIDRNDNIIRSTAIILRLTNDLGESPLTEKLKSEDTPKAIECYMKENGASEKDARERIRLLVNDAWKEMNRYGVTDTFISENLKEIAIDMARAGHYMYHHGDGHAHQNSNMARDIAGLFFQPICTF